MRHLFQNRKLHKPVHGHPTVNKPHQAVICRAGISPFVGPAFLRIL
jgi:hypothetical protein